ncbi:hypothetical protein J19TS2_15930 [Cohnella xylanilytica]|uniref:DUF2691 family protein n=1 Tax=Cohnella xylanilytica TaxID=557555 RepID=A0A841TZ90_9BACL|nr:DUF2691 family protein [Cohnella xylanilytica]MBB6691443.1 DUF2691 family protein [Cohnella xylanilytica]GIO12038.1 hypothetical protein J19TS2_15930 [Cohnella xylanilytica]
MRRGIQFEIPNRDGTLLGDVLSPVDMAAYDWLIGDGEEYRLADGKLEPLWPEGWTANAIDGRRLRNLLADTAAYVIFADLKAYPKGRETKNVAAYEEFLASGCQLVLLVVDCAYTAIYAKDQELLERLYGNAQERGYDRVQWITDDNDFRTKLSVW